MRLLSVTCRSNRLSGQTCAFFVYYKNVLDKLRKRITTVWFVILYLSGGIAAPIVQTQTCSPERGVSSRCPMTTPTVKPKTAAVRPGCCITKDGVNPTETLSKPCCCHLSKAVPDLLPQSIVAKFVVYVTLPNNPVGPALTRIFASSPVRLPYYQCMVVRGAPHLPNALRGPPTTS